jgi:hypothetical protein
MNFENKSRKQILCQTLTIFTIIIKTSYQTLGLFLLQDYLLMGWTHCSLADRYQSFAVVWYLKHDISTYQTTRSYMPQDCSHKTLQYIPRFHIILPSMDLLKFKNQSVQSFFILAVREYSILLAAHDPWPRHWASVQKSQVPRPHTASFTQSQIFA